MFSRKDYLAGTVSFADYYEQFVTERIIQHVVSRFGLEKLAAAYKEDEHLNNIPLRQWDLLGLPFGSGVSEKMKEAGDYLTQAGIVCILKRAAKMAIERGESSNG